ncbi:MAG: hypothetical protein FWG85_04865 [Bacteroidetes bacterium]|nr:hypothetical protein [Bacteroidota bacterium]
MFKSKHYKGNGTLAKNTDTSSNTICSKNTTSNVVETTVRGGDSYYKACSRIVTFPSC